MSKKIIKVLLVLFCVLFITEISLRVLSKIYAPQRFPEINRQTIRDDGSFRIMFIGDSWTAGAGAENGKGYVEVFFELLRTEYPRIKIEGFNYGRGSFNSSEACLSFLKYYREINPDLLVVLIGTNNAWNTQDVSLAHKLLNKELDFEGISTYQISFWEKAFSWLTKLKIVKFCRIFYYNIMFKPDDMIGPHPTDEYAGGFFDIYAKTGDIEKGKAYLIKHINEASSYDDFYRLMLYAFGCRGGDAEFYLRGKGLWCPDLIRFNFDQRKQDSIVSLRYNILKDNIVSLKKICDMQGIKIVMQNYPQYGNKLTIELNNELSEIAKELDIHFVDHYALFTELLGIEGSKEVLSKCKHVNSDGHYLMTQPGIYIKLLLNMG